MARTHGLVLYIQHFPDATRPAKRFQVSGIDVQSLPDVHRTTVAHGWDENGFDDLVSPASQDAKTAEAIIILICIEDSMLRVVAIEIPDDRSSFLYREHWKAELVADLAGDSRGFNLAREKSRDPFGVCKIPTAVGAPDHGSDALDDWAEVSSPHSDAKTPLIPTDYDSSSRYLS